MRLHDLSKISAVAQAPQDLINLGRIVSAYGVQGWVKLQPFSLHAAILRTAKQWWLTRPALPVAAITGVGLAVPFLVQVQRVRSQGRDLVAQFAQRNDRDQAEMLKGCVISVSRAFFPQTAADEFYWVDLVGCDVYGLDNAQQSALIGVVDEVLDNSAHAILKIRVYQIDPVRGMRRPVDNRRERPLDMLVPFVAAHIYNVDLAARRIDTYWPTTF